MIPVPNPFVDGLRIEAGPRAHEVKVLLPDGTDLAKALPIRSLTLRIEAQERDVVSFVATIEVCELLAKGVRLALEPDQLRQMADALGYEIRPKEAT